MENSPGAPMADPQAPQWMEPVASEARVLPFTAELNRCQSAVSDLDASLGVLATRLDPLLGPQTPFPSEAIGEKPVGSQLTATLAQANTHLEQITAVIRSLTDRLEI
jgi:hypothetical protein